MSGIVYARERDLGVDDYIAIVGTTYMRDRRPLSNRPRIARMLEGSDVIVTARDPSGALLGLARGISDGDWVCYLADLVVREDAQRRGIGKGLLTAVKDSVGPGMAVVLVAFPEAADYYRRIGLGEMAAFYINRELSE